MSDLREYLWIAVLGGIFGFAYGFLIGANDVANAFASSVSSKSVTLKQAVIIASIFEFSGAFFLGAAVTGTIRSKIFDPDLYADEPAILMLGMFTSLVSAVIMLFVATHFGLPVSTTHDIVGCIMGFSIAAKGFESINWDKATQIFISWVSSPLLSGAVAFIFFAAVKYAVLKSDNPYKRAYWTFPIVLTVGIGIDLFYVLYKAGSNLSNFKTKLSLSWVLPVSFGAGFACGLIWIFIVGPIAKRRVEAHAVVVAGLEKGTEHQDVEEASGDAVEAIQAESDDNDDDEKEYADYEEDEVVNDKKEFTVKSEHKKVKEDDVEREETAPENFPKIVDETAKPEPTGVWGSVNKGWKKLGDNTFNQDLHAQSMHENPKAAKIWDDGIKYDPNTEGLFTYLQVFTACLNSFAHGANDVSNTIAPLSAIISIYQSGQVQATAPVQKWVLAFGGAAIVLGLLLYGYRVMKSVGYKLTVLSPSRGASAELASSLVVVTASFNEIPVSSTQCIVGAISGVGLVGGWRNVQWLFLARVCVSWVVLFFVATVFSAGLFSFVAFSPSLTD